jgi:hypothetical protein
MKNLETLRIRRSRLNPDSFAIFREMPALKHLTLDRNNWRQEDKARFREKLPDCQFEPVTDTSYWDIFPKYQP